MFDGDYREMNFILNDGSNMRVATCEACLLKYEGMNEVDKEKENKSVMANVYAGWEYEAQILVADKKKTEWDDKKRENYLSRYKQLEIVTNTDKLDPAVVERKYKKHLKLGTKKLKKVK